MTLIDATRILDEVIPPPHDKMVDHEHFNIAVAWQEIKVALNVALKQTYAEKVITALRDDGRSSLSFKDVEALTADEIREILPIADQYSTWLEAVALRAIKLRDSRQAKNCNVCGTKMLWEHSDIPGQFMESSCYLGDDWPICHDCMVEHCVHANCLGCNYGKYPDCRFLNMKTHYMKKDS